MLSVAPREYAYTGKLRAVVKYIRRAGYNDVIRQCWSDTDCWFPASSRDQRAVNVSRKGTPLFRVDLKMRDHDVRVRIMLNRQIGYNRPLEEGSRLYKAFVK